jgi:chemotaxis protein methyltransferase CheR
MPSLLPAAAAADPDQPALRGLLEAIYERYGYDFRHYAYSSLKRRVLRSVAGEGVGTIAGLRALVLEHPDAMARLQATLTIHVTAMFRDPGFFLAFREQAVPALRTYPFLRLWVAGCSTGEEVYSLAILLHETGLYSRCRIYATDVSDRVLDTAKAGIFPIAPMQEYTRNYQRAGGDRAFAEYYCGRTFSSPPTISPVTPPSTNFMPSSAATS